MTKDPDRDYYIAEGFANGIPIGRLAEKYGVRPERVRIIARENASMIRLREGREVPNGLPIRTAVAIEGAIGIWPTIDNAAVIDERRIDILRSQYGRRVVMQEIDQWLKTALATQTSA